MATTAPPVEITVARTTHLGADARSVWGHVTTPRGINDEFKPWMRMTVPRRLRDVRLDRVSLEPRPAFARLPGSAAVAGRVVRAIFGHRHRRLRARFG